MPATHTLSQNDPLVGQTLGAVSIDACLGRGAMGVVYRGHHVRLDRVVAVKILSQHLDGADEEHLTRFQREAQAAARLDHPSIIRVYDVGEDQGHHFIVMEYVDGISLHEAVRSNGPCSLPDALRMAIDMASALQAADEKHIVHRDVKPENILLAKDGSAHLSDFGLASLAGSELTQSGRAIGTPHYMAPEQARGEKVDIRSDLYALGGSLYYALSGRRPFRGENPLAIMMQKNQMSPIPLSDVSSSVSESLSAYVETLLAPDPAKRPQTPAEVMVALRGFLEEATQDSSRHTLAHSDVAATPTDAAVTTLPAVSDASGEKAAPSPEGEVSVAAGLRRVRMILACVLILAGGAAGFSAYQAMGEFQHQKPQGISAVPAAASTLESIPQGGAFVGAHDAWQSVPLRLAVVLRSEGVDAARVSVGRQVTHAVIENFMARGMDVLEREQEAFDMILRENSPEMKAYFAPEERGGNQPGLLRGRVLVVLDVTDSEVLASAVDYETSELVALAHESVQSKNVSEGAQKVAGAILLHLRQHFPARGVCVPWDDGLRMTVGTAHGLMDGDTILLYPAEGSIEGKPLGTIQVEHPEKYVTPIGRDAAVTARADMRVILKGP